jgi:putative transposase
VKLDSDNHSVFLMCDHLVLVVKYRRNVIDDTISDYAKDKFVSLSEKYNITLRRISLMFEKSYGKKCFGQEVFVC